MAVFIARRLIQAVPVLLGVTLVVFLLVRLTGDPVSLMVPQDATLEQMEALREYLGLRKPLPEQYLIFLGNLLRGDLGFSMQHNQPNAKLILERLPATVELALAAMAIAIAVAIPIGIFSALKHYTLWDNLATVFALLGRSMPTFWLGVLLILVFAVNFRLVPPSGRGEPIQLILPAVTLSGVLMATLMRLTRSSLLEELNQDYVRTAWAKGLPGRVVVLQHALRNALIPIITVLGLQFGALLVGAVITETIFAWPGLGRLTVQAIYNRDLSLVQASVLCFAIVFIICNLTVDLLYAIVDPRIRRQ